jgi:tubulin polyglutamylase TTLL4
MAASKPIEQVRSNPRISQEAQRTENEYDDAEDEDEDQENETDNDPIEPVSGQVHIVPSVFGSSRAPTIYFEYPPELNICRQGPCQMQELSARKLVYLTNWERNCVKNAFARAGFERSKNMNGSWNGYWGKHPNPTEFSNMNRFQKVNHFPGSWCIGRKDRLARTLLAFQRRLGGHFDFHPDVLHLPVDRRMLDLKIKADKKSIWIIKPQASSCGRGIRLISKDNLDTIPPTKKAVIQKYLEKPHLINGRKYDLRLYVLVTSCDPLRVYLFEKGLVRFCANKYSTKHLKSKYTHLTNYSINKKSDKFVEPGDEQEVDEEALKWSLEAYWKHMAELVGSDKLETIQEDIKKVIVKTMIAAESDITPNLARLNRTKGICYELFGFDVILDHNLKPWLLEVNVSPSLMGSSPLDRTIKGTLMADVFHLVGFQPYDDQAIRKDEKREAANKLRGISDGRHKAALSRRQDSWRRTMSCESIELKELSRDDWDVIYDTVEENQRRGHFERIYPTAMRCKELLPLFIATRFNDVLLHRMVSDRSIWAESPLGPPRVFSPSSTRGGGGDNVIKRRSSSTSSTNKHTDPSTCSPRSEGSSASSSSWNRKKTHSSNDKRNNESSQEEKDRARIARGSSRRPSPGSPQRTTELAVSGAQSLRPSSATSSEMRETLMNKMGNPAPPPPSSATIGSKHLVPTSVFKMHAMRSPSYREANKIDEDGEIRRLEKVIEQSEGRRSSHLKIVSIRYILLSIRISTTVLFCQIKIL